MDHMASIYTCKRKINRWPIVLFKLFDTAGIVRFVILCAITQIGTTLLKRRCKFLVSLGEPLSKPVEREDVKFSVLNGKDAAIFAPLKLTEKCENFVVTALDLLALAIPPALQLSRVTGANDCNIVIKFLTKETWNILVQCN